MRRVHQKYLDEINDAIAEWGTSLVELADELDKDVFDVFGETLRVRRRNRH